MNRHEIYLQTIRWAYPDLRIESVEFNDKGQNNDVLIVNHELVFRFPRYAHALEQLKVETAILTTVREYVPLAIPNPTFVSLEAQAVGEAFVGYRMIAGEPLWRGTFRAIREEGTLGRLADQLGGFLHALHGVPVQKVIDCDLPVSDTYEECVDIYTRMREKLFGYMRPDAREWVAGHFETFLGDPRNFQYQPVLKHGDFGPTNVLFDAQAQAVAGIIDFGNSGLGDPAYDFAGLLSGYGEPFVRRCGRAYPQVESFLERIRFYQGTFALIEALFGIENGDEEAFRSGIETYV